MFTGLHGKRRWQLIIGFCLGVLFGFLLQKGGVTRYDVIIGQLLLTDFTVVKVMLTAVVVGTIGVHLLERLGMARLHPKPGSWGATAIGGLIFGVGFAVLGYCPGTLVAAIGQGSLDALFGGLAGLLIGAGLYSELYPRLERTLLHRGDFGELSLPRMFRINPWWVIFPLAAGLVALLFLIERSGF